MTSDNLRRLKERSIGSLSDTEALEHIALLIDTSLDEKFEKGARRALYLLNELEKRELPGVVRARMHYFRANAHAQLENTPNYSASTWSNPETRQQLLQLSLAWSTSEFSLLPEVLKCQILTNRANILKKTGRLIEALEGYEATLKIKPDFAMSHIGRGYCCRLYGSLVQDDLEQAVFILSALNSFEFSQTDEAFYECEYPKEIFDGIATSTAECERLIDATRVREALSSFDEKLGRSRAEREYRYWCLQNRLFLNPLNDVYQNPIAANDSLTLPPIYESFGEREADHLPPPIFGFFNQLKQEFVSARFTLYEGLQSSKPHFSDRAVNLFNTLDYPFHALSNERVRMAFRIAYSLLDKVAFFINYYWKFGKAEDRISFKNVWLTEGKKTLLDQLEDYPNLPLRGLYWLSLELFDEQLRDTTAPDAQALHDIRNALEHKYLLVHRSWAWEGAGLSPSIDGLGVSITDALLELKALRVIKMTRAALIQLALAVGVEERKQSGVERGKIVASMPIIGIQDRDKMRF